MNEILQREAMEYDVVIIGAGIIGLAIAEKLVGSFKNILVLEKEKKFGQHISSRNSEVIHSGIYHPINSLKSQLCIRGNDLLYKFLKKYDIPYLDCGKLIVASNKDEEKILDKLFLNGINKKINGLEKYILNKSSIRKRQKRYTIPFHKDRQTTNQIVRRRMDLTGP